MAAFGKAVAGCGTAAFPQEYCKQNLRKCRELCAIQFKKEYAENI
jgi:hypothetical protein